MKNRKNRASGFAVLIGLFIGIFMILSGFKGKISFPDFLMKNAHRIL